MKDYRHSSANVTKDDLTVRLWEEYLVPRLRTALELQGRFEILRAYANGQLFGLDGSPHKDAETSPPHFTLLYYPHGLTVDAAGGTAVDTGGETVFFSNHTGRPIAAHPVRSNRAVLFPSSLLHAGRATASQSRELRVTVAFKLVERS